MGFPSKEDLNKIREDSKNWEGTLALPPDATPLERFRYQICQELLAYKQKNGLKSVEMAKKLSVPEADLSRIFHYRLDGISTDRLLGLLSKVSSNHQITLKVS